MTTDAMKQRMEPDRASRATRGPGMGTADLTWDHMGTGVRTSSDVDLEGWGRVATLAAEAQRRLTELSVEPA